LNVYVANGRVVDVLEDQTLAEILRMALETAYNTEKKPKSKKGN
jgi:hypothetical protein